MKGFLKSLIFASVFFGVSSLHAATTESSYGVSNDPYNSSNISINDGILNSSSEAFRKNKKIEFLMDMFGGVAIIPSVGLSAGYYINPNLVLVGNIQGSSLEHGGDSYGYKDKKDGQAIGGYLKWYHSNSFYTKYGT